MRETPPPVSPSFEEWQKGKRFKSSLVLCQRPSAMPSVTTLIPKSSQRFSQYVSGEDIPQRKRTPSIVRTGWSSAQPSHPFGKWVYDNLKYRRIAMIGYDFAFGWEVASGFQRTFEEAGGQIVQNLWPPLFTADFGPYIAQLKRDVDAVYAVFSGADALRFPKQSQE